jgi:hypothetical protein
MAKEKDVLLTESDIDVRNYIEQLFGVSVKAMQPHYQSFSVIADGLTTTTSRVLAVDKPRVFVGRVNINFKGFRISDLAGTYSCSVTSSIFTVKYSEVFRNILFDVSSKVAVGDPWLSSSNLYDWPLVITNNIKIDFTNPSVTTNTFLLDLLLTGRLVTLDTNGLLPPVANVKIGFLPNL